jgi:hypothetical protein
MQKVAGKKYDDSAFTSFALTIVMVDFSLQSMPEFACGTRRAPGLKAGAPG